LLPVGDELIAKRDERRTPACASVMSGSDDARIGTCCIAW
jgi:hypothetical protein